MAVVNVTLSGTLVSTHKNPIVGERIGVYSLSDLFHVVHIQDFTTGDDGRYSFEYRVEYPLKKVDKSLFFISRTRPGHKPLFKQFVQINREVEKIEIDSPPLVRKKRRLEPSRISRKNSSSSFERLAKSSLGKDWQFQLMKFIPNATTEAINENYRITSFPLDDESVELEFLQNPLFFATPEHNDKERKTVYNVPALGGDKKSPAVEIEVEHKLVKKIVSVSLSYEEGKWLKANKGDPNYLRFLYIANSAAIFEGLVRRGITWGYVLPSIYAHAFLSTISKKNPFYDLLSPFLTEDLLFERHLGLPFSNALLEILSSTGVQQDEILRLSQTALNAPNPLMALKGNENSALYKQANAFIDLIIKPFVTTFFECHSVIISADHWKEMHKLSEKFASLFGEEESKCFIASPRRAEEGDLKRLKMWCSEALLYTLFMPYALRQSFVYLTDLEFASLNPVLPEQGAKIPPGDDPSENLEVAALQPAAVQEKEKEDKMPSCGGTKIEQAWMQLTKAREFIDKERKSLLEMPEYIPIAGKPLPVKFKVILEENARDLLRVGLDIKNLTI